MCYDTGIRSEAVDQAVRYLQAELERLLALQTRVKSSAPIRRVLLHWSPAGIISNHDMILLTSYQQALLDEKGDAT